MEFYHQPVLLHQALDGLKILANGIYVDGTVGGAGHALAIAKQLTAGKLFAFDQDPDAVQTAQNRLAAYPAEVIQDNFSRMKLQLTARGITSVDGILLDLGVSSHQLDQADRGFSYQYNGALNMRMSQEGLSAATIVNEWDAEELQKLLWQFGEEPYAKSIVSEMIRSRPIETTGELVQVIQRAVPARARRKKHPAKRTFQALRIAVNQELEHLQRGLNQGFSLLKPGGRLVVITFHSLEDRMVKQFMAAKAQGCTCPPEFPVCVCGKKPEAVRINKKPILPSPEEQESNARSKSAKLRILEKIESGGKDDGK